MASRYRGPKGRFTTKAKWKRGKKRGDKRYKREPIKKKVPPPPGVSEWLVTFSYDRTGRSFDVIVTARDEQEAFLVARRFLRGDPRGRNISRSGFKGWSMDAAKGKVSDEEPGEAEYREDTEE